MCQMFLPQPSGSPLIPTGLSSCVPRNEVRRFGSFVLRYCGVSRHSDDFSTFCALIPSQTVGCVRCWRDWRNWMITVSSMLLTKDFNPSLFSSVANYLVLRLNESDAKALVRNVASSDQERTLVDRIKQLERFKALYFSEGKSRPSYLLRSS